MPREIPLLPEWQGPAVLEPDEDEPAEPDTPDDDDFGSYPDEYDRLTAEERERCNRIAALIEGDELHELQQTVATFDLA